MQGRPRECPTVEEIRCLMKQQPRGPELIGTYVEKLENF